MDWGLGPAIKLGCGLETRSKCDPRASIFFLERRHPFVELCTSVITMVHTSNTSSCFTLVRMASGVIAEAQAVAEQIASSTPLKVLDSEQDISAVIGGFNDRKL